MSTIVIVSLIVLALVVVILAIWLGLTGGAILFAWALQQSFVGMIAFFAAWVFLFPVMVVLSIGIGLFVNLVGLSVLFDDWKNNRKVSNAGHPIPGDPDYYEWANRHDDYSDT